MIKDDIWMEMLRIRDNLAHDYDGELAKKYFMRIISVYYQTMIELKEQIYTYYCNS